MADWNKKLDRRFFASAVGSGAVTLLASPTIARAQASEPHLYIHLHVVGGLDSHYMFDARPLAMTDAGYLQNYFYRNPDNPDGRLPEAQREPVPYTGTNGQSTLRSAITDPLLPYLSDYSILNGVVVAGGFGVGHGQNERQLFTGSVFGGDSLLPIIGRSGNKPLESVKFGRSVENSSTANNFSNSVLLATESGSLSDDLRKAPDIDPSSADLQSLQAYYSASAGGNGNLSQGVSRMMTGLRQAAGLRRTLISPATIRIDEPANEEMVREIPSLYGTMTTGLQYLQVGATTAIGIVLNSDFAIDTHDPMGAANSRNLYTEIVKRLEFFFKTLKQTEFRGGKSFYDVSTVVVSTDFGRTMRQLGTAVDNATIGKSGTDHNTYTSTMLVGGKGIKAGQVIGESDMQWGEEGLEPVSSAHREVDPQLDRAVGKPFDFDRCEPRRDRPSRYKRSDYLTVDNVVNTVFQVFEVDQSHWRAPRGETSYAVVKKLLKNGGQS